MKKIEIKLSQPIVAPLLDFVKPLADGLREDLAFNPKFPDADPQFQESWREDLLEAQTSDATVFMGLFDRDFFESGNIEIDEENGDAVLRAAAAIRLKLRVEFLKDVPDEVLEHGDVPFEGLSFPEQQAYACYLFLATIQEIVIQHLDMATGR
jgi:hypothetical protein